MNETDLRLLTPEQVCDLLQIKLSFLYDQCQAGNMPYLKLGRMLRFRHEDLMAWLDAHAMGPESLHAIRRVGSDALAPGNSSRESLHTIRQDSTPAYLGVRQSENDYRNVFG